MKKILLITIILKTGGFLVVNEYNIVNKDKLENLLNKPVPNSIYNIVGNICWVG